MLVAIIRNAILLIVIDIVYLTLVAPMFKAMVMQIQGSALKFRLAAAIPVYLALGYLLTFAGSARQAAMLGAATYAVYDFTNYATLRDYTLTFALIDTAWGGTLFALTYKAAEVLATRGF